MDNTRPANRSALMSRIRSSNTKPEMRVRRLLHAEGFRFRLHRRDLPGNPDLVFAARRAVLFVDGCFWHQHGCALSHIPVSRKEYWLPKLARTKVRDSTNRSSLAKADWNVNSIWECETKQPEKMEDLISWLRSLPAVKKKR